MAPRNLILLFLISVIGLSGCDNIRGVFKEKREVAQDDVLLAKVEDRAMYLSDIDEMIIAKTAADSTNQLNSYIESWIKRNVVLTEAENNFPENVDIDKLVEDYRSSLLLHNYRRILIEKELDTIITKEQELKYYEANKDQYLLESKICKGRIAVIPETAKRIEKFYRNWKKNDTSAIAKYVDEFSTDRMEEENTWFSIDEFLSFLPAKVFKVRDVKMKADLQKNHDDSEYFVKINDVLDKNEIAPLSYVKESIRKVIIHQRKKQILDNIEQDLYKKYLKSNRIKVFTSE